MNAVPGPKWLPVVSLLVLGLVHAPPVVAAPAVQGALSGTGTASTFTIYGGGAALEGAAADWTLVCSMCLVRLTWSSVEFFADAEDGRVSMLGPGAYELREFTGVFVISEEGPGQFFVQVYGHGEVIAR